MRERPERIYLQVEYPDDDFGVTWCQDQINDTDVEYIRADIYAAKVRRLNTELEEMTTDRNILAREASKLAAEVERLRAALMEIADMQPVWDASGNAGLIVVQGMVRAALGAEPYDAGADLDGETAGVCETCGKPMQHVRPGKWQCPECG